MSKRKNTCCALLISVLLLLGMSHCQGDPDLLARFSGQNYQPHYNAVSLLPGERTDNYFDIVVRMGKRDRDTFDIYSHSNFPPVALIDVAKVTFDLEYWDPFIQFVYEYEAGDFFERACPTCQVRYVISEPSLDQESGMTLLHVDVFALGLPQSSGHLDYYCGDLLTLKFRANRSGNIPVNFAGRYGSVFNSSAERISGISWYGGYVNAYYD